MAISFGMVFRPGWQKRYGECHCCQQGVEAGTKIIVGTGYWKRQIISNRFHYECWLKEFQEGAKNWWFKNNYEPKKMDESVRLELNRLRSKRNYIRKKVGDPSESAIRLADIEDRIKLVK